MTSGKPPAEVCLRIEVATHGRFKAEDLRPDLKDVFASWRRLARKAKARKAA
jgi:DNA-binding transcriptional regulator YdaS (Cro superfamily)